VEREKLVALLNEDLASEFRSMVQYVQHFATVTGPEYQAVVELLRPHLGHELEHARILAEQIAFLGGTPTTVVPAVPSERDPKRALELDLELEQHQLEAYRERVEQAASMGLPDVAEVLRPLLEQTQDHVRDLQSALGR
jgi:bacterioferritin